jgi:large subunit ribosomal protein L6
MSRIGKKSIEIPSGVNVAVKESLVVVEGPKGKLSQDIPKEVEVNIDGNMISVSRVADNKRGRSFHGLVRTLIDNMVTGVSTGFARGLEISGVGYRAEVIDNKILKLFVGYSKPVEYEIPEGISVKVEKQVNMVVGGVDKEFVGRVAAQIRGIKKPEPYKGKGIRYAGEKIRRKVGKSAGK